MTQTSTKAVVNVSSFFKRLPLATAIASSLYLPASHVAAQEAEIEEITITGSRIARDGYDSPTPISILGQDDLDAEVPASRS